MAGLGGAFGGLLGNSVLQQIVLFQVVGGLVAPAMAPFAQSAQQISFGVNPTTALSPADAAEAVLRTVWTSEQGRAEARLAGVNPDRFDVLALLAGNAPDPTSLAVALRRGLIDHDRYTLGIAQGRLRNEWAELVRQLSVQQPSPTAMLEAELEGQLSHAEALQRYTALGGDPDYYQIMFNTQGQAPTPSQALELANRGIIPWQGTGPDATSYEQAFLEGPWRNKWLKPFQALGAYLPPPRTVTAMYKEGSLTHDQAATLLAQQGLAADLVTAYLISAANQKTATTKDLAQSTILAMYHDRIILAPEAQKYLENLGYDAQEAGYIIAVADAQLSQRFLSAAINRAHSRYVAWKIDKSTAVKALTDLGVPASGQSDLLALWDIERTANTAVLTPAQIAKAWHVGVLDQPSASTMLQEHGYSAHDAWLYLSQYQGSAAPNEPPAG